MKDKRHVMIGNLVIMAILLLLPLQQMLAMDEPEYLIFEGQSDSWKVVIEVRQSKRNLNRYVVSERHELNYSGEPIEGEVRDYPVEWRIQSVLSSKKSSSMVSHFSEFLGTAEGGTTMETNASSKVADVDDVFQVDIVWNEGMNEQVTLACVAWE